MEKNAKTAWRPAATVVRASPPNPFSLALSVRKTGILPVREDSASSLSAHETTG
jgi:hypothetical protein